MEGREIVDLVKKVLDDKKAQDIIEIDVQEKTAVTDYFVIASGRSTTQVKAFYENLKEKLEEAGVEIKRKDGVSDGRWIVVDIGDVIVHIFHDEMRLFYHLERLWQ